MPSSPAPTAIRCPRAPRRAAGRRWLCLLALAACNAKAPAAAPVQTRAPAPVRGAAGDEDLRVMLAEVASAKACALIEQHFQALPALKRPNSVSGTLWIRGCKITSDGTQVKFALNGNGWQWIDEEKQKAGGTFSVRQYVRFAVNAHIAGTLDVAYDRASRVATVWFSPQGEPQVQFTPVGDVKVDAEGAWSSMLSAAGTLFASSPDEAAKEESRQQGATEFKKQFEGGVSVTVDMCRGLARVGPGRIAKGKMAPAGAGETKRVAVELQPGGLMIFGPQPAGNGMTVDAEVAQGTAGLSLVCTDQAQLLAAAFMEGTALPPVRALASTFLRGKGQLRVPSASCPVSLVARALPGPNNAPITLTWQRPKAEAGHANGGRLIACN